MSKFKLKLHKILHWEYWPMEFIYYPLFPIWLYFAIRARSFFFFNAANPSIKNGGMAMESKKEIYDLIPEQYIPKTLLIKPTEAVTEMLKKANAIGINFPFIVKPDIGMKAFAVAKIDSKEKLEAYANKMVDDFLIQELIEYSNEIGVFYIRKPNEDTGKITGIVSKEFLKVIGDGKSSIRQLILENPRGQLKLIDLEDLHGDKLNNILPKDTAFTLVPFGSHTRGSRFVDDTNKLNDKLFSVIEHICKQVPEFYYGRLDIRHNSFEDLSEGKNFSIIEINGAGSEAAHIYDSKHSLFFAWSEIIKHWKLLYEISVYNRKKGHYYLSFKEGMDMLKFNSILEKRLKTIV